MIEQVVTTCFLLFLADHININIHRNHSLNYIIGTLQYIILQLLSFHFISISKLCQFNSSILYYIILL